MGIEEHIPGFEGISLTGYGVEIKQGKHVRTPQGEFVEMKNGEEYSIKVVNLNSHGCQFKLNIDGQQQGSWQLSSLGSGSIERPADIAKKFTFYRVKCAPKGSGIQAGRSENGLVTCTFTPEKGAPTIDFQLSLPCHSPTVNSAMFSLFGKHSTRDLTDKIKETLAVKYKITDVSDYDVIKWYSEEATSFISSLVDLHVDGDKNQFLDFRYNGICDYWNTKYYLDCLPKIKSIWIKYEGETFHHNTQAAPTINVISQMIRKLGLRKFHMKTESGRYFCSSMSSNTTSKRHIYNFLNKADILDAVRAGALTIEAVDNQSAWSDSAAFEIEVRTLMGKSIPLLLTDDNTVEEIKQMLQGHEGMPIYRQRLIVSGQPIKDGRHVLEYPAIRALGKIFLVQRLLGGGEGPTLRANGELQAVGKKSGKKSLDTADSDWVSGATALGKASRQTFRRAAPMEVDPSKVTTLILRLVARGDELVAHPQVDDVESTPLSSQVPPPVPI